MPTPLSIPLSQAAGAAPPTGPATTWPMMLVGVGLVMIIVSLARMGTRGGRFGRFARRRPDTEDELLAHINTVRASLREPPPPGLRLAPTDFTADAEELARRLAAELDDKAARLERLLARAEATLQRLELAEGRDHRVQTSHRPAPMSHPATDPVADPVTEQVYALADQGRTPVEIAQRLGQPTGNIELMLALRR